MAQPSTAFSYRTLEDMRTRVYAGIRRKSTDPLAGLSPTFINEYIAKWDAYFVDYARWNMDTFRRQKILPFYEGTTVYSALATTDSYAELTDNSNASATGGRISINGDLISYSAKDTPTSGKSVTISASVAPFTPDVDHVAGERVEFLVPVPSDFGKPGEIWYMQTGSKATSKITHKDWREMPIPTGRYYTHHDGYLILPQNISTQQFQLHYWKKGLKPTSSDSLQTPEQMDDVVRYGAIAECALITKEFAIADDMFARAGLPNPRQPGAEMNGLLQYYAGMNAEQTHSTDEVFIPDLGSLHM